MSLNFWTTVTPTAHKEYVCDLCGGKIKIGEKYERFSGKNDGEMFDIKHHMLCTEIIRQYCDYIGEQEYDADSVCEWVTETCADCEHYDEDRNDFTPCTCSTFQCPKVIKRFSKEINHE
jgi:hypothetical protein